MRRVGSLALVTITLVACRSRAEDHVTVDTVMVFTAPPPAAAGAPVLRVAVLPDATIHADDQLVNVVTLKAMLDSLQAAKGQVWLYRDRAALVRGSQVDSVWRQVVSAVAQRNLPSRFARRADFSDLTSNRQSPLGPERFDDSVAAIFAGHSAGRISLEVASKLLADLLEPMDGLAASPPSTPEGRELLEATIQELARRSARRR